MSRLNDLVRYWKLRLQEDLNAHVKVERANENNLYLVNREDEGRNLEFGDRLDAGDNAKAIVDPVIWNYCLYAGCHGIVVSTALSYRLV